MGLSVEHINGANIEKNLATKLHIANNIATSSSLNIEFEPENVDAKAKHKASFTPNTVTAE